MTENDTRPGAWRIDNRTLVLQVEDGQPWIQLHPDAVVRDIGEMLIVTHLGRPDITVSKSELITWSTAGVPQSSSWADLVLEAAGTQANRPIAYKPSSISLSDVQYELRSVGSQDRYGADPLIGTDVPHTFELAAELAASPNWEDRIRAHLVVQNAVRSITLPDGFPCIYEAEDSPSRRGAIGDTPTVWVKSADEKMLAELLPLYQELWDSYTYRWGPGSRRVMALGRRNGLDPYGVYHPGTTVKDVIGSTLLTHTDMYKHAPERLKQMHPRNRSDATGNTNSHR